MPRAGHSSGHTTCKDLQEQMRAQKKQSAQKSVWGATCQGSTPNSQQAKLDRGAGSNKVIKKLPA
eukprot:2666176-Ditylum_brightwellii.AAC.1